MRHISDDDKERRGHGNSCYAYWLDFDRNGIVFQEYQGLQGVWLLRSLDPEGPFDQLLRVLAGSGIPAAQKHER